MTHHALPRVRPRRQRPRWAIPLAALAVVLVIGLTGGWLALSGDEEPEVPVVPIEVTAAPPASSAAPPTTASIGPVEPGAVKPPVVAFGEGPTDGLWPVSTQGWAEGLTIAPGTYRTAGAADTAETGRCSWRRESGLVKSRNSVRGPVEIRLQAGDHFWSQGCQQWIRGS